MTGERFCFLVTPNEQSDGADVRRVVAWIEDNGRAVFAINGSPRTMLDCAPPYGVIVTPDPNLMRNASAAGFYVAHTLDAAMTVLDELDQGDL